jgi:predicted lipid-binding transport protein (Tim44 family)
MAGPGNEMTPGAGFGHLRASHADRERLVNTLKAAFVQGRLSKTEFDQRVSQALAVRTYADLAAVTVDLPAARIRAEEAREFALAQAAAPAQAAQPVSKPLMWGMIAVVLLGLVSLLIGVPMNNVDLMALGVLAILTGAPVAGTLMLDSWRAGRSGRQLPPPSARGTQAPAAEPYGTTERPSHDAFATISTRFPSGSRNNAFRLLLPVL